jgi:conjugal transfer/type IV secretion protein DotA/TraY
MSLVATPGAPGINEVVRFLFLAKTCKAAEEYFYGYTPGGVQAYIVRDKPSIIVPGSNAIPFSTTNYDTALGFSNYGNITIVFGARVPDNPFNNNEYQKYKGGINPLCGEISLSTTSVDQLTAVAASGAKSIQETYFNMIKEMWMSVTPISQEMGRTANCLFSRTRTDQTDTTCADIADEAFINRQVSYYNNQLTTQLNNFKNAQVTSGTFTISPELRNTGWAGAAIWYNRRADLNGNIAAAIFSPPNPTLYPRVMEYIAKVRKENNESISSTDIFDPTLKKGTPLTFPKKNDLDLAIIFNKAHYKWKSASSGRETEIQSTNNTFLDTVNSIFGVHGIFQIRCNTDIHPLAQLTMLGKGMMYAAVRNFGVGTGLSVAQGLLDKPLGEAAGEIVGALAKSTSKIGMSVMAMSFMLAYVLPFMPFIYFTFAIMGWLKAIFEALVAMPLWALSHITRIDGQGLPGPAATNGYFLLLEIFLRPILILFGLLASIQIFSALVFAMNQVFDLVTANVGGFSNQTEVTATCANGLYTPPQVDNSRANVDRFFYTLLYVILCYMLAQGCFKLIDYIPNSILRWAGVTVSPLAEPGTASGVNAMTYKVATIATQDLKGGALLAVTK